MDSGALSNRALLEPRLRAARLLSPSLLDVAQDINNAIRTAFELLNDRGSRFDPGRDAIRVEHLILDAAGVAARGRAPDLRVDFLGRLEMTEDFRGRPFRQFSQRQTRQALKGGVGVNDLAAGFRHIGFAFDFRIGAIRRLHDHRSQQFDLILGEFFARDIAHQTRPNDRAVRFASRRGWAKPSRRPAAVAVARLIDQRRKRRFRLLARLGHSRVFFRRYLHPGENRHRIGFVDGKIEEPPQLVGHRIGGQGSIGIAPHLEQHVVGLAALSLLLR